jgi:DNA repair protein RadC
LKNKIENLPLNERPYEKLELYGENSLNNSELLSIVLKTGTKESSVIELSKELLSHFETENDLYFLITASLEELQEIKGIGRKKAIELKAISEIAKRIYNINKRNVQIKTANDIVELVKDMQFERKEILKVVILNTKNFVLSIKTIAIGDEKCVKADPKHILSEVIKLQAPKMILVHNHPSGDPTPSIDDIAITKRVNEGAEILNIQLLDHIIIGHGDFISILNLGRI